jgi:hypothetical protein
MRPEISTIILAVLAVAFGIVAYLKDPGLPLIGARNGLKMLWFVLPRLVPALILAGMLQVLVPQEVVSGATPASVASSSRRWPAC